MRERERERERDYVYWSSFSNHCTCLRGWEVFVSWDTLVCIVVTAHGQVTGAPEKGPLLPIRPSAYLS